MADTIPGGAYLSVSGQWVDANGAPLDKGRAAEAERLAAERQAARDAAERQARALDAERDPTARAIARALEGQPARPAKTEK